MAHILSFAPRDVSRPGEPASVTASAEVLEQDYDVLVATHPYGRGQLAYLGDINCEEVSALLVAAFIRSAVSPVPAWSYAPTTPAGFLLNASVTISGLKGRAELNGTQAIVIGHQNERVQVKFDEGSGLAIKMENLTLVGGRDS